MTATMYLADIEPGVHITRALFGWTFNVDTILSTLVAAVIVVGFGLYLRSRITAGTPSKPQLVFETITDSVQQQVESTMKVQTAPWVVPLAITLFMFILIANWLSIIPSGHPEYLPPPASDVNLTYALALMVILPMHVTGIRRKGFFGYYRHLAQPYWFMFPINFIEELARPVTLALRLFGNIFSGTIMVSLITLFPAYILWGPEIAWKLFDMVIGLIQAFIFALLTVLYFGSVTPSTEPGGH